MSKNNPDIAIVGGGLSGGLIAIALQRAEPSLAVSLIEAGDEIGGNHRWSWFETDLGLREQALLSAFPKTSWDAYEVRFPEHSRTLSSAYRSLASEDFAKVVMNELPAASVRTRTRVTSLDANGVTLADGERIHAGTVIDCRGVGDVTGLTGGWQVFMGRRFQTEQPHGIAYPIIMDATVEQLGGYRFVYVLPLGPNDIFVEDTYYADSPKIDEGILSARIDAYCAEHGWHGEETGRETGALPVITGGDFSQWQALFATPGVARAGARGGFVHPLTSYTLPYAARTALKIADNRSLSGEKLSQLLVSEAQTHWRATGFYRMLGIMLFGAARPEERYRIFQRFYRLSEPLIERFYASRSTLFDRARVLCGKPPIPIPVAVRSLLAQQPPLVTGSAA